MNLPIAQSEFPPKPIGPFLAMPSLNFASRPYRISELAVGKYLGRFLEANFHGKARTETQPSTLSRDFLAYSVDIFSDFGILESLSSNSSPPWVYYRH